MLLVHQSPTTLSPYKHPQLGVLCSPRRVYGEELAGWKWAADNDAYSQWDETRYRTMLDQISGRPGCLFVTAPDVVGDADATLELFYGWRHDLRTLGLPIALVAQDGLRKPPWKSFQGLFIGGTTEWKMSDQVAALVISAKRLGKWVHMGRVNTVRRRRYAHALGCDSVDGSSLSWFRDTYLPNAIKQVSGGQQLMLREQNNLL